MCNSLNKIRSQDNLAAVVAKARYSTSVEEREIVGCFFDDQEIGQGLRKTRSPKVEQQSVGTPAQSAFEKTVRDRGLGVKEMPLCKVP